jgi:cyclopropane-fatty-acyl-phospholipid synthase
MSLKAKVMLKIIETGLLPDKLIRLWINNLCSQADNRAALGDIEARHAVYRQIVKDLRAGVAIKHRNVLQEQLCEMEVEFYRFFLGKRLLESCCYFPTGAEDLDEAEETMLWMSADRARIRDGMEVLELGCGWGAMTFWLARQYPEIKITAVIDSVTREISIQKRIHELHLKNVKVVTCDFEDLQYEKKFDRVICIERFDYLSANADWQARVAGMLKDDGKFFVQMPLHQDYAFYFDSVGLESLPGNVIMSRKLMLSADMPLLFQKHFCIGDFWKISGEHYQQTAEKRLKKFYFNRLGILPQLEKAYGKKNAWIWFQRWRCSLLTRSELCGYNRGQNYIVGQYLFNKKP